MSAREQCDKLLDERSLLLYGVKYDALDPIKQSNVIAEAVLGFDPKLVDYADSLEA